MRAFLLKGASMPRQPRVIMPGFAHHIVQRGNNRNWVLSEDIDKLYFLKKMREYSQRYEIRVAAYSIMSNHVHLQMYPVYEEGLIVCLKLLFQSYSQHINRMYGQSGKVWENRYKMSLVDPAHEWNVAKYIELNPVRAGMVRHADDYLFSSCRGNLGKTFDVNISHDIINKDILGYAQFLDKGIDTETLEHIRKSLHQEKVFGTTAFVDRMESVFGRVLRIRRRGRPKNGK